jgi:serine/threonine protein kinase
MPPEALKHNNYSVSCDIWALGVIFFQMVKGVVPWRAMSEKVLYEKIMNEPLEQLIIGMPEIAKRFMSEVLSLDPKARPTVERMQYWSQQLKAAHIEPPTRYLSPFEQRGRNSSKGAPLR